jgi:hypothetical protein
LLPTEYLALAKLRGLPAARIHGVLLICKRNLMLCVLAISWIVSFIQLAR